MVDDRRPGVRRRRVVSNGVACISGRKSNFERARDGCSRQGARRLRCSPCCSGARRNRFAGPVGDEPPVAVPPPLRLSLLFADESPRRSRGRVIDRHLSTVSRRVMAKIRAEHVVRVVTSPLTFSRDALSPTSSRSIAVSDLANIGSPRPYGAFADRPMIGSLRAGKPTSR